MEEREGRRGIISFNNGVLKDLEKRNESILSMSNLRQGIVDVFATFGDLLKDAFGITSTTTKKVVGEHLG